MIQGLKWVRWALSIFAVIALAGHAMGADLKIVSVKNTTGIDASDLHVTFTGTGGSVFVAPASVVAPPCPVPAVPSNGNVTNTVVIDWGIPCVAPGATVSFWVYTPNGPLGIASANWTLNGNNIGPVRNPQIKVTPPPDGTFWAINRQTKCIGAAWAIYTPWLSFGDCWRRWCCLPNVWCFTRTAICKFVTRRNRIINTGICFPIDKWTLSFRRAAWYAWQFASIRPPNMGPQIIPINGGIRNGPPLRRVGLNGRAMHDFGSAKSDNSGQNWSTTTDFRSTFIGVASDLAPLSATAPDLASTIDKLLYHAPFFATASARFEALRQAVMEVDLAEPDPNLTVIANDLAILRDSFNGISTQFASGVFPNDPLLWENCRVAIQDLSNLIPLLMPARGPQVQQELQSMAAGFEEARDMVALGFTDMMQEDNFLYAVFLRIVPSFEAAGMMMGPHVRINLNSVPLGWYPQLLSAGAVCYITNATTGEELDTIVLRVTENGSIVIPIDQYDMSVTQLRVGFKFDSFLSQSVNIPNLDGTSVFASPLVNGDADGDDAITQVDVAKVNAEFGTGGGAAGSISSSDVNADGIVNIDDLNIVQANQGLTGNGFRLITGTLALGDFAGNADAQMVQIGLRDVNGNVLETHDVPLGSGHFAILTARPTNQTLDVTAKGSHWLQQAQRVTLGGADEPFNYANGNLSEVSGGTWSPWTTGSGDAVVSAGRATLNATTDVIREFGPQLQEDGQVLHWSFDVSLVAANTANEYYFFLAPASAPYDPGQNYNDSFAIVVDFGTGPGGTSNVYTWPNTGGTIYLVGTMTPGPFHTISGTMVKSGGLIFYTARIDGGTVRSGTFLNTDPRGINAFEMYQSQPTGTNGNARVDNIRFSPGSSTITSLDFWLQNGDLNGDNEVSIGDYALLSFSYNAFPGDLNYIEEADLNGDESVDIGDYAILSAHFGEFGD